jgi:hypothetical protein
MSYCANQWLSSYTFQRIWNRLAAEDVLAPGAPMAAAATGESAPAAAGLQAGPGAGGAPAPGTPRTEARPPEPAPAGARPGERDAAASEAGAPDRRQAAPGGVVGGGQGDDMVTPAMRAALEDHQRTEGARAARVAGAGAGEAANAQVREGDFVNVIATVNLTENTGDIAYVNRVARALVPTAPSGAELGEVRAVDANGRVLASHSAPIKFDSDKEPGEDRTGIVDAFMPAPAGAAAIEVLVSGRVVARRDVGAALPTRPAGPGTSAATTRAMQISPTAGPGGREILLDWSAAGAAPAGVTYSVLVSTDGGGSWQTLGVGLREPRLQVDTEQFGAGRLQMRVLANNGLQTEEVTRQDVEATSR